MTRAEVKAMYRVVCDPSWQVQKLHKGQWVTVWYCGSEATARRCRGVQVARTLKWLKMTVAEREAAVLRDVRLATFRGQTLGPVEEQPCPIPSSTPGVSAGPTTT